MQQADSPRRREGNGSTVGLLRVLTAWTETRTPLPEVLRGLADEYRGRSRRGLLLVAKRIENGDDLQQAFDASKSIFPRRLRRQLAHASSAGDLRTGLTAAVAQEASMARIRGQVLEALLYPMIVLAFVVAVALLGSLFIAEPFREVYEEFQLELPAVTANVLAAADHTPWIVGGAVIAALVIAVGAAIPHTAWFVHWLATAVPVLGRLWIGVSHHALAQQLSTYLSLNASLPYSLRSAAAGLPDRNLARAILRMADRCEGGEALSDAMADSMHVERPLAAAVRSGEYRGETSTALYEAVQLYEQQIAYYLRYVRCLAAPVLLVFVGGGTALVVIAFMLPLVQLVENLS